MTLEFGQRGQEPLPIFRRHKPSEIAAHLAPQLIDQLLLAAGVARHRRRGIGVGGQQMAAHDRVVQVAEIILEPAQQRNNRRTLDRKSVV